MCLQNMKRFTSIALSACLCLALAGCKTDDKTTTAAAETTTVATAETTTAPAVTTEATTTSVTTTETTTVAPTTAAPTTAAPTTAAPTTAAPLPEDPMYKIPEDTSVKISDLASKYGFTFGGCIGNGEMNNAGYKSMIADNFASVTATNELKAYSLLNQAESKKNADGMPGMYFGNADKIVKWAQENGIGVRGHVLVWDAYMTDWFFREGYDSKGEYVDAETMKKRLEYYIDAVITHFETEFPGVVYCWDVVNEAVGDSSSEYAAGDPCHIRTKRNGDDNIFYTKVGEDYIYLSFLYARNTVEKLGANIKLFYNDYNTFMTAKRNAIIELVKNINSYAKNADGTDRKLCDGVGMQGYIGGYGTQSGCMNKGDIENIRLAIVKYAELDVEVHMTEVAVRNYNGDEETVEKHARFYADLMNMLKDINGDGTLSAHGKFTNFTSWGLCDNPKLPKNNYSYKMNGPYCGLFNEKYERKNSFYYVYNVLQND